jgi:Tfp pilus assembly protein PilF
LRTSPFIPLSLAVVAWAVYINSLTNPFVYDDFRLIVENTTLATPGNLQGVVWHDITRPVVNLSYAVDAAIWGLRPLGFHITNVLLHAVNVMLVFAAALALARDDRARRTAQNGAQRDRARPNGDEAGPRRADVDPARPVAIVAALLFAVHPMLSQAVGYISARSDVLCATFVLLAFLAARRFLLGGGWMWAVATLAAWVAALGAKEVAAMLPLALLAYDALILPHRAPVRRRAALHVPLLLLVAAAAGVRVWVLRQVEYDAAGFDGELALVAIDAFRGYLQLLLWPAGQTIFHALAPIPHPFDLRIIVTVALFGSLIALTWTFRQVSGLLLFGLLWFLLFLIPSGALFVLGRGEALAEHRVYLSSVGVFVSMAALAGIALERVGREAKVLRWTLLAVVGVVALQLGGRTLLRNAMWADPVALWRESVDRAPQHWLPHLMLGEALRVRSGCGPAEAEYRLAIRFAPEEIFAYKKLGGCLIERGAYDEAEAVFVALRDMVPTSAEGPTGLAIVAMAREAPNYAQVYLREALVRDPDAVLPRQLLATLEEPRDPAAALQLCQEIKALAPYTPGNEECIQRNQQRIAPGP